MSDHVVSLEIILKVLGMEKETRNKTNKVKNRKHLIKQFMFDSKFSCSDFFFITQLANTKFWLMVAGMCESLHVLYNVKAIFTPRSVRLKLVYILRSRKGFSRF